MQIKEGKRNRTLLIGAYYFDDSITKTNGEFDIALQIKDNFDIDGVRFYSKPHSLKEMRAEEEQIRNINRLTAGK